MAPPRDFLLHRKRRVAKLLSKFLGGFFLALADVTAINDDIVFVHAAVDPDGAEREFVEAHGSRPRTLASGALLRHDPVEGGPALLDFLNYRSAGRGPRLLVLDEG